MSSYPACRPGDGESLAGDFLRAAEEERLDLRPRPLEDPAALEAADVMAVHFANSGAQGDPGAVELLVRSPEGARVLYGNYADGGLDLDALIAKLPMLRCLVSRYGEGFPYPYGRKLEIPPDWEYLYMGALNHFFVRTELFDRMSAFLTAVVYGGRRWQVFEAAAWFWRAGE